MAKAFKYWQDKKSACKTEYPSLKDIQLMDLHSIAQYLLISDVVRNDNQPRQYRWRYWGTFLTNAFGLEISGKLIHEALTNKTHDLIAGAYNWMVENGQPHFWVRRVGFEFDDQDHLIYQRLVCPREGPPCEIDYLFGIFIFTLRTKHYFIPYNSSDKRTDIT